MNNNLIQNIENNTLNNLEISNNLEKLELEQEQNKFLQSNLGQAINSGIDLGLKAILPDIIEDEIIAIKDSLITEGFSAAISTAIEQATNFGKSITGIVTGNFENVAQIKKAVEKGGLIDTVSSLLDTGINWAKKNEYISSGIASTIKSGKNVLMKTIENKIDNNLTEQAEAIEKIDSYIEKWKEYFNSQNFTNMEYQYKNIEEYMKKVIPFEDTIKKARVIENLHERIKNNGKDFNIMQEEKELSEML